MSSTANGRAGLRSAPLRACYSTAQLQSAYSDASLPVLVSTRLEPRAGNGESATTQQQKRRRPPPALVSRSSPGLQADVWQNAVVLIDKPCGWTSFDVCGKLRSIIKLRKVGHAGTLDPNASGLLIICTGQGTKHVETFMAQHKEYHGTLRLGEGTVSYDADTEVSKQLPWEHITDADLDFAAQQMHGNSMQLPPMYSAIKVKGERLYKAARRGEEVERQERAITITKLELERMPGCPQEVLFRVACSKGTYVRSLVHDLGCSVGSVAHMKSLRRTKIGDYCVEDAWSIDELHRAVLASREESQMQISNSMCSYQHKA